MAAVALMRECHRACSKTQRILQIPAQLRPRCPGTFRAVHHFQNQCSSHPGRSAAAIWPPLRRFIAGEYRLGLFMGRRRWTAALYEFLRFGIKQAWACLFGGIAAFLMIATWWFYPASAPLPRYDFLFLGMLAVQLALLAGRLETADEAKVILIYHAVGTAVSIDKLGSWFLLLIISYTLVSLINPPRQRREEAHAARARQSLRAGLPAVG